MKDKKNKEQKKQDIRHCSETGVYGIGLKDGEGLWLRKSSSLHLECLLLRNDMKNFKVLMETRY